MYAIIETGGKQYRVAPGDHIEVERLNVAEGSKIELDRVLLIADGDKITQGQPTVDGAKVVATCSGEGKGKKVIVYHYKPKTRYHKKNGHRQLHTRLSIDEIITPGAKPQKKARRKKEEVKEQVTENGA